jgi:hypothetical protein
VDARTKSVRPGRYEFKESSGDATPDTGTATHQVDTEEGTLKAAVTVAGNGRAEASARLGQEFKNEGTQRKLYYLTVDYEYRAKLNADTAPTRCQGLVDIYLSGRNAYKLTEESLSAAGQSSKPTSGGFVKGKQKFEVSLAEGEAITVALQLKATAELSGAGAGSRCVCELEAKLNELSWQVSGRAR